MITIVLAGIVLLAGAALCVFLPGNELRARVGILSQLIAVAIVESIVPQVLLAGGELKSVIAWPYPVGEAVLRLDALGAFFLAFSMPMTLFGSVYAHGYLQPYFARERHVGVHYALLNTTQLSYLMIYTIENGMLFFFGWEVAALSAWLLVIWDYPNDKIRFAGFNYLISTHLSLLFLVAAFMNMRAATGSFAFEAYARYLSSPSPGRDVTFVLLIISFGLKSAFYPFHTWLPRAHSAAPAHVSALMSGVIHKAGIFGMLRFTQLVGAHEAWMGWFLIGFSSVSAFGGVLYTVAQRDLKRLLGYSSTENVGICGIGIGVGVLGLVWKQPLIAALGFTGGTLHVLNHALFKCLLFYGAGSVYRMTHGIDLERMGGLLRSMPLTAGFFLTGALAISALPPLNGFVSELCIYAGLLSPSIPGGVARAVLIVAAAHLAFVGAISALSMTRAFGVAFLGVPRDPERASHGEAPTSMLVSMGAHALGVVALGLWPPLGLALASRPAAIVAGAAPVDLIAGPLALLRPVTQATLVFLGVLGLLLAIRSALVRGSTRSVTWGCGYTNPNARMQYSASSFSAQLTSLFPALLRLFRREKLPTELFPGSGHHLNTHCVDTVERRMFKVIGEADDTVHDLGLRIPEDPRFAFALGLVVLSGMVAILFATGDAPP